MAWSEKKQKDGMACNKHKWNVVGRQSDYTILFTLTSQNLPARFENYFLEEAYDIRQTFLHCSSVSSLSFFITFFSLGDKYMTRSWGGAALGRKWCHVMKKNSQGVTLMR